MGNGDVRLDDGRPMPEPTDGERIAVERDIPWTLPRPFVIIYCSADPRNTAHLPAPTSKRQGDPLDTAANKAPRASQDANENATDLNLEDIRLPKRDHKTVRLAVHHEDRNQAKKLPLLGWPNSTSETPMEEYIWPRQSLTQNPLAHTRSGMRSRI